MSTWSVFDWNNDDGDGHYVYFEGPGDGLGIRPKPRQTFNDDAGHKLEDLLPILPSGSRLVGRGDTPKGRIAVLNTELRAQYGVSTGGEAANIDASGLSGDASSTDNPLLAHPWWTIFGWAGLILGGYYVARWVGSRALR